MKKLMVGAVALIVAVLGFGSLTAPTTHANPAKIWVVNQNVLSLGVLGVALPGPDLTTTAGRATAASVLTAAQTASAGQVSSVPTVAGATTILIQTDGSTTPVSLNARGLTCTTPNVQVTAPTIQPCDGTGTYTPATDGFVVFVVNGGYTAFPGAVVTASQNAITLDSVALKAVAQARDEQLSVLGTPPETTIQEGAAACSATASAAAPTVATAQAVYRDVNGLGLVGYQPTFKSSSPTNMAIGGTATFPAGTNKGITMLLADGKTVGSQNAICGVAASTGVTLSATTSTTEVLGIVGGTCIPSGPTDCITRTQTIVVTGVPAAIALTASPAAIACDGTASSSVTAKVTDAAGNNVVDNTPVTFSVVALGTANPIQTKTKGGTASSTITPLSGSVAGATVIVTSGSVQASIRVDCIQPTPTTPPAPVGTPTKTGGTIGAPNTGTGGYLGQDSTAGFPLWTLIALGLGSVALVAGGLVTRHAGK